MKILAKPIASFAGISPSSLRKIAGATGTVAALALAVATAL
jgi:hypothetical protein